ncbi:MAG TPA: hypothetical protein VNQ90_02845 [Chthoniobacteraceae bacterium]|nr:hypothetical protein [Chthoniobacteraceae bacterium]
MFGERSFFTAGRFSSVFTFKLPGGDLSLKGNFDNAFYSADLGESELESSKPRAMFRFDEVESIPRGTLAIHQGALYSVIRIEPDGTGFATVVFAHEVEEEDDDEDEEEEE